ncbi:MAG: hypothetical protein JXA94_03920 [Parachlamydiales bacterium]|nr:hypothetical protein [Parachlamydiales bacterium]
MSSIRLSPDPQTQTFVYASFASDSDSDSDSEIDYNPNPPRSGQELWKIARILIRKGSPNYFTYGVSEKRGVIPMDAGYRHEKKDGRYPDETVTKQFNVIIDSGKLYYNDIYTYYHKYALYPPTIPSGYYLFVLTQDGDLRMSNELSMHHSYFDQGQAVKSAGSITVNDDGKIAQICNDSGHYEPKKRQLINIIAYLRIHGYQMGDCKVTDSFDDDPNDYTWQPKKSLELYQKK